jgi:hypothetical protein
MEQTFNIVFDNFIRDNEFEKMPKYKGIYLFRLTIDKGDSWDSKVIYIGRADGEDGFAGRVKSDHEHLPDARKIVDEAKKNGKNAFLTIAYSNEDEAVANNIERIESALIFAVQPTLNDKQTDSFNFDKTTLNISGKRYYNLNPTITVPRTK